MLLSPTGGIMPDAALERLALLPQLNKSGFVPHLEAAPI